MPPCLLRQSVVARLREAVPAAEVLHHDALIRLPQEPDDPFFRQPLVHVQRRGTGLGSAPLGCSEARDVGPLTCRQSATVTRKKRAASTEPPVARYRICEWFTVQRNISLYYYIMIAKTVMGPPVT